jgi:hypothetical protein
VPDLYFTEDGDLRVSSSGDLTRTQNESRNVAQQIYLRVMTDLGDFPVYPNLGAQLNQLFGMPQTATTGRLGEKIILQALKRDGRLDGKPLSVKAIPTGNQTIRFDIYTLVDNRQSMVLSVEQDLGVVSS